MTSFDAALAQRESVSHGVFHMTSTANAGTFNALRVIRWLLLAAGSTLMTGGALATPTPPTPPACDERAYLAALFFLDAICARAGDRGHSDDDDDSDEGDPDDDPQAAFAAARVCGVPPQTAAATILLRKRRGDTPSCFSSIMSVIALYRQLFPDRMVREEFRRILRHVHVYGTTGEPELSRDDDRRLFHAITSLTQGPSTSAGGWEDLATQAFDAMLAFPGAPEVQLPALLRIGIPASVNACDSQSTQTPASSATPIVTSDGTARYTMLLSRYEPRVVLPAHWRWRRQNLGIDAGPELAFLGKQAFRFAATAQGFVAPGSANGGAEPLERRKVVGLMSQWLSQLKRGWYSASAHRELDWIARGLGCSPEGMVDNQIAQGTRIRDYPEFGEFIVTWDRAVPVSIVQFQVIRNDADRTVVRLLGAMLSPSSLLAPFRTSTVHGGIAAAIDQLALGAQTQHLHAIEASISSDLAPALMAAFGFQPQGADTPPAGSPTQAPGQDEL